MTKDEIIAIARDAGFSVAPFTGGKKKEEVSVFDYGQIEILQELKHFAQLVAAKEREACAKALDDMKDAAEQLMEDPDFYIGQYERMCAFEDAAEAIRAGGGK